MGELPMSQAPGQVIVVGGGVIGAACAHYLNRAGWTVTVVDSGGFGQGCSHANCGFVCPSHVLPLAAPGAVKDALRSLLRPNSPLSIKPRFDPSLWAWLFQFARRCNRRAMIQAGHAIQALLDSSRALYQQLMDEEALECEWQTRGLLFVFQTQAGMHHYAQTDQLLRDSFGVAARRLDGDELTAVEPALKPGLAGGWLYTRDAHLRPDRLMDSWRQSLQRRGVTVREGCAVRTLVRERGQARAVVTTQGELSADAFVIAAGALTPLLGGQLGCTIPIQPGKGYSITMARPARCPALPLLFDEHRVAATPMHSGYRLGSTMEFAGYDTTINPRRLALLREGARHYLHEPVGEPVEEEWFGWRPMTYDGIPIIDRSPAMSNVLIAAGHNMLGLSMATGTGKLVAEMLDGSAPHVDPTPYSLRRFA
jgi:D-amino-acid dehydrogenase